MAELAFDLIVISAPALAWVCALGLAELARDGVLNWRTRAAWHDLTWPLTPPQPITPNEACASPLPTSPGA